jgi:uncharacterized protein YbaP (TraB family)
MKRTLLYLIILLPSFLQAQPKIKNKKYQGLLWEISGNGMKKNSYLFGTMHVSSKMAFHLADSFYVCIHNADMVALETNPESWQEDMSRYDLGNDRNGNFNFHMNGYMPVPDDYLTINTLKFYKYDKKVERALYTNPSTINNLLYRTYGNESSDFEEDTYLDMYIYQCGKKWGKKVAGVERYGESMKLMAEAYRDAAKDRSRKERSYDGEDGYSSSKLQEAYRSGNLDWLDSINKYNSFSAAFDEKFLYRRNEIQASSIDSILRSGQSLFVGVGAAHLPGNRGVIEILRKLGYRLRPVKMGVRDSQHKNQVEKLRVPVAFNTQEAADGLYKVDIPGKFYQFGEEGSLDQRQYADMANGSYYMVTRIMTNAWMWGHNVERVSRVVDSLLYENIPGKIISKTPIVRNGNKGIDVVNRTRRGDIQRYNIFVTPFEVVIFKMSGTGDYVNAGEEAKKFFGSIRLREYAPAIIPVAAGWKKFTPSYGGFSVDLPHAPFTGNDGSWIFDAEDKATNTQYRVVRTDIHNYHFTEEDSFDLSLMEESFSSSDFIDKEISRRQGAFKGYPSLDCQFRDKSGNLYFTRFVIQGPHYYSIIAHGKQEIPAIRNFLNSFEITPLLYKAAKQCVDTSLFYSVESPVFPDEGKEKIDMQGGASLDFPGEDMDDADGGIGDGAFKSKVIANDTTGEKIFITFFKPSKYTWLKDSTLLDKENQTSVFGDTSWIVRRKTKYQGPSGMKVWETIVSDTGSSRTLWTKAFYKDGTGFLLAAEADTLTAPSAFVRSFYDSFTPADTLKGMDIFAKKTALFFADFMSSDSITHKKAVNNIFALKPDSTDLLSLKKAISFLNWKEKRYLGVKKSLIGKLDEIKTRQASDYLRELYYAAGDTLELQYAALEVLLQQKTAYAFQVFRDIVVAEPPVINMQAEPDFSNYISILRKFKTVPVQRSHYDDGEFLDELSDSLELTKTILPGLLPLLNLDDYKQNIMRLLGEMIDEHLAKPKDYEAYINRFLLEAKQEWKKQVIGEKQKAIRKAESSANKNTAVGLGSDDEDEDTDRGNENLKLYTTLLLPYWQTNTAVAPLLNQFFTSSDTRLKYTTAIAFLRDGRSLADTLLGFFAGKDEYRYELYSDLAEMDMQDKFPSAFSDHLSLARSKLVEESQYDKPDSLVYLNKLPATVKGKEGFVFFFKYKKKKDDEIWRLATVGLVPKDPKLFEFTDPASDGNDDIEDSDASSPYSFTGLTAKKISDDVPLTVQLNKELRRMLYSKRRSAKEFYDRNRNESTDEDMVVDEAEPHEEGN